MSANTIIESISDGVAGINDPAERLAVQVGTLQTFLRALSSKLSCYTGEFYKPSSGCLTTTVVVGGCSFLAEYEFDAGEPGKAFGPPDKCYEADSGFAIITGILVNGAFYDPAELGISDRVIQRWVCEIIWSHQQ